MKIRVTTDAYEYMGLKKDTVVEAEISVACTPTIALFSHNGKQWKLDYSDWKFSSGEECRSPYCECEEGKCSGGKIDMRADEARKTMEKAPIKSDGGSSSYYDLELPAWLLYTLNERQKEGKCYIKTEEMISAFFGNDFDRGNIIKSLVRCQGLQEGTGGKAGNSVEYECNKMIYSVNKIKEKK